MFLPERILLAFDSLVVEYLRKFFVCLFLLSSFSIVQFLYIL